MESISLFCYDGIPSTEFANYQTTEELFAQHQYGSLSMNVLIECVVIWLAGRAYHRIKVGRSGFKGLSGLSEAFAQHGGRRCFCVERLLWPCDIMGAVETGVSSLPLARP
jgi:hypothetical protein